jgi:hypothetical protein
VEETKSKTKSKKYLCILKFTYKTLYMRKMTNETSNNGLCIFYHHLMPISKMTGFLLVVHVAYVLTCHIDVRTCDNKRIKCTKDVMRAHIAYALTWIGFIQSLYGAIIEKVFTSTIGVILFIYTIV